MAADATALLARLELDHAAHALQLVEVLVQQVEVEHLAGRGGEVRRAVVGDADRAEHRLGHVAGPAVAFGDRRGSVLRRGGAALPEGMRLQRVGGPGDVSSGAGHVTR